MIMYVPVIPKYVNFLNKIAWFTVSKCLTQIYKYANCKFVFKTQIFLFMIVELRNQWETFFENQIANS